MIEPLACLDLFQINRLDRQGEIVFRKSDEFIIVPKMPIAFHIIEKEATEMITEHTGRECIGCRKCDLENDISTLLPHFSGRKAMKAYAIIG